MTRLSFTLIAFAALTACEQGGGDELGPRGGTVVSEDGRLSVEIRPGALDEDISIAMHEVPCASMDIDALGCYQVSPKGVGFSFPARVTFELDDATLDGGPADELAILVAHGHDWNMLADRAIDVDNGTLSGSAVYLSSFAVARMR